MGMLCTEMKPVQRHTSSMRDENMNGLKKNECVVMPQKQVNNILFQVLSHQMFLT